MSIDEQAEQLRRLVARGDASAARESLARILDAVREKQTALMEGTVRLSRLVDLGQAAAELIHEMRQPLLGILAWSQFLQKKPSDATSVVKTSRLIEEQTNRMVEMLDTVRRYGQVDVPGLEAVCRVNEVVRAAHVLLAPRLRKARASFETSLDSEDPCVPVGFSALQQVLVNLFANAVDIVPERTGRIDVRTLLTPLGVEIYVQDNGPGVSPEIAANLFEAFRSTKKDGMGLGLHISRNIVREAGGSLEIAAGDSGATFVIRLPAVPVPE